MHRGLYKTFDVTEGYILNIKTNENCGKHVDLYCYTADENNIYYDEPHIDYPDNYVHVLGDKQIPITKYMQERGDFKTPHAVISRGTKLTSIEPFHIDECNTFFAIPIHSNLSEILKNEFNFTDLIVLKQLWDWKLIELKEKPNTPFTLLFFLDSDDKKVRARLNDLRLQVISQSLSYFYNRKIEEGIFITIDKQIIKLSYTQTDRFNLINSINSNNNILINAGKSYGFTRDQLIEIKQKFDNLERLYDCYCTAYFEFVKNIFKSDFKMRDASNFDNFLIGGYSNAKILENLNKEVLNGLSI